MVFVDEKTISPADIGGLVWALSRLAKETRDISLDKGVIDWLPFSPNVLNHRLTNGVPLRHRQAEGVIIANGWSPVPPALPATIYRATILLRDFAPSARHDFGEPIG